VPAGAPPPAEPAIVTRIPRVALEPTPTATARPPRSLPPDTVAVEIQDSFFQPGIITVTVGTTVRWYHEGGLTHSTRALNGVWSAPDMHRGDVFAWRFEAAGEYRYLCLFHAGTMLGSVVVVPR
jgi:plastocyanin